MKQKLTTIIAILVLAFASVSMASAQGETLPLQLDYVNAELDVFIPRLDSFQAEYYGFNGQYFQAVQSHSTIPAGVEPADITSHPTDQEEVLATLWNYAGLPLETNWALQIDTYNGPDGPGYVLTVSTNVNEEIWIKSINFGPDTWRSTDWYKVNPSESI
jgi:hypothetical protein